MLIQPSADRQPYDGPHPHANSYGPCDAFGVDGSCARCSEIILAQQREIERLKLKVRALDTKGETRDD